MKIITICIHYLRRSSCEESKAHLFLIKAPASPSPGESGELQRQGEIQGTEMKALSASNPSSSDLEENLVSSPAGSRAGPGGRASSGQSPTELAPWDGCGVIPPARAVDPATGP